jgi:hypothetical protein
MLVRTAWIQGMSSTQNPNNALCLQGAVDKNLEFWSRPDISKEAFEGIEYEWSDPSQSWFDEDHQTLVHTLLKLHLLSITQGYQAYTPTLQHLLEAEKDLLARNETDPIDRLRSIHFSEFVNVARLTVGRKRLFVTKARYIGLGPGSMKEGDVVWIFPGAGAMFVLRACDDDENRGKYISLVRLTCMALWMGNLWKRKSQKRVRVP